MAASGPSGPSMEAAAGLANVETGEALTAGPSVPRRKRHEGLRGAARPPARRRKGCSSSTAMRRPFADGITIRQLLNHTSGLDDADIDQVAFFEPYRRDPAHRDVLGHREQLDLGHEETAPVRAGRGMGVPRQQLPRARADRRAGDRHDAERGTAAAHPRAAGSRRDGLSKARSTASAPTATLPATTRSCRAAATDPVDVTELDLPVLLGRRRRRLDAGRGRYDCFGPCSAVRCFPTSCARRCSRRSTRTGRRPTGTASASARSRPSGEGSDRRAGPPGATSASPSDTWRLPCPARTASARSCSAPTAASRTQESEDAFFDAAGRLDVAPVLHVTAPLQNRVTFAAPVAYTGLSERNDLGRPQHCRRGARKLRHRG